MVPSYRTAIAELGREEEARRRGGGGGRKYRIDLFASEWLTDARRGYVTAREALSRLLSIARARE